MGSSTQQVNDHWLLSGSWRFSWSHLEVTISLCDYLIYMPLFPFAIQGNSVQHATQEQSGRYGRHQNYNIYISLPCVSLSLLFYRAPWLVLLQNVPLPIILRRESLGITELFLKPPEQQGCFQGQLLLITTLFHHGSLRFPNQQRLLLIPSERSILNTGQVFKYLCWELLELQGALFLRTFFGTWVDCWPWT